MKYRSVADIDMFIDTRLFAFPYIDDVKEILRPGELDAINAYADKLKASLKYLNHNITKEEREYYDFYPKRIKHMFDCLMFRYYEKPFFDGLLALMAKYGGGYVGEMIDDFYYKKQYDAGIVNSHASRYLDTLQEIGKTIELRKARSKYKR